jgi:hypothetical protein
MRARAVSLEALGGGWGIRGTDGRLARREDGSPWRCAEMADASERARRINDDQARRLSALAAERAQALARHDTVGVLRAGLQWERAR